MIIKMFGLILFFSLSQSKNHLMHNLPMGEYRMEYDKIYQCASTKNHSIQFNLYLNKKTLSIKELKGNITFLIPFDDTLAIDINSTSWDLTGGWKPNSNIITIRKACSGIKYFLGSAWITIQKGFNIPTDNCPLPAGTYLTSGIDLKNLEVSNFPKVYFYGKYKLVLFYKNAKNEEVGCLVMEVNLIRPWETPL
ncbi:uncharacterized protein LOC111029725 [Myzus persicae]|uniref:uncharacterized protein LOC111029725 n=1 Tax=Myzus persicae TaxID=13164 RepID=UPI000B930AE2|nr:uncharacterized protein LOC111029725 [Myzus persicae]